MFPWEHAARRVPLLIRGWFGIVSVSRPPPGLSLMSEMCSRCRTTTKPSWANARRTRCWGASTGNRGTCIHPGFRDKRLEDLRLLYLGRPEGLDVEPQCRGHIRKCLIVGRPLADDPPTDPQRVCDLSIRVLLNDNFEGSHCASVSSRHRDQPLRSISDRRRWRGGGGSARSCGRGGRGAGGWGRGCTGCPTLGQRRG